MVSSRASTVHSQGGQPDSRGSGDSKPSQAEGVLLYSGPANSEGFLCISSPLLLPPARPPQSIGFCPSVLKSRRSLRLGTQPRPFSFPQKTWLSDYADLPLSFESSLPFPPALSLLHTSKCPEANNFIPPDLTAAFATSPLI